MLGDTSRSFKIFTWLRIPVFLHWSFFLIFVYAFYIGYSEELTAINTLWLVLYFLIMFGCVLLHEYGHAIAARRYGVATHDIILTPLGGMARLARIPEKPKQEFVVAIAGPLVNIAIALLLFAFGKFLFAVDFKTWALYLVSFAGSIFNSEATDVSLDALGVTDENLSEVYVYIPLLIITNLMLFAFNLLPAFPMDGGRILRSLLSMNFGRLRATKYATWLGQAIAVLFIANGIYSGNFLLALIGVFVISTARSEYKHVKISTILRNYTAAHMVRYQFTRIYTNDWMRTPIDLLRHGHERAFIVFDLEENPVGILRETEIMKAQKERKDSVTVAECMEKGVIILPNNTSLAYIYGLIAHDDHEIILVRNQDSEQSDIGVIDSMSMDYFMEQQSDFDESSPAA
jgi:Zn-dependent protease